MSTSAIRTQNLVKKFGDHTVLDGLDLDVAPGTVYALLGPNGAGKTTTINILSTLLTADDGHAEVAGFSVADSPGEVRSRIGLTGQFSAIDELLTGRENLRLMGRLHHLPKREIPPMIEKLLETFDLVEAADKPATTYSGGMKRRLDLAMTLVGDPDIIFLDEPTTGLDPRSRRTIWNIVERLVGEGTTILLTTQYLEEADELASTVSVLDGGRIVATGTPSELKRRIPGAHIRLTFTDRADVAAASGAVPEGAINGKGLVLDVPTPQGAHDPDHLRTVLNAVHGAGVVPVRVEIREPSLDDVFFALTGNPHAASTPSDASDVVTEGELS